MSEGLAGGYPGSPNAYTWVKNNESKTGAGDHPLQLDAMPGEKQAVDWGVFPLVGEDTLYVRWNGGGGYGDPLLRPGEEVQSDVAQGLVSPAFAENVYGVIIDHETGQLDKDLTDKKRTDLLSRRKKGTGDAPVANP